MKKIINGFWIIYNNRKMRLFAIAFLVLLIAWFGLGYYLHAQAKQSQARLEQKRIETSRREEASRRQAIYQQEVQKYQQSFRPQSRAYGE